MAIPDNDKFLVQLSFIVAPPVSVSTCKSHCPS